MTANKWKKASRKAMLDAYGGEQGFKNWGKNLDKKMSDTTDEMEVGTGLYENYLDEQRR